MKNYYKILEISERATEVQIKKAYRSLAKKYHPDKSNAVHAAQLFTEINEAYEVLSDTSQKLQYDQQRTRRYSQYEPERNHRQPRYRSTYHSRTNSKVDLEPYMTYFKSISITGLLLSLLLSVDFLIPRQVISDRIIDVENVIATNGSGRRFLVAKKIVTEDLIFEINQDLTVQLYKNQPLKIRKTSVLRITTSVDFVSDSSTEKYFLVASIYRNFSFAWIILLITSIIGTVLKKSPEMILNFGIVNGILMLLVIYFTLIS